jgi:hypothetical protein
MINFRSFLSESQLKKFSAIYEKCVAEGLFFELVRVFSILSNELQLQEMEKYFGHDLSVALIDALKKADDANNKTNLSLDDTLDISDTATGIEGIKTEDILKEIFKAFGVSGKAQQIPLGPHVNARKEFIAELSDGIDAPIYCKDTPIIFYKDPTKNDKMVDRYMTSYLDFLCHSSRVVGVH